MVKSPHPILSRIGEQETVLPVTERHVLAVPVLALTAHVFPIEYKRFSFAHFTEDGLMVKDSAVRTLYQKSYSPLFGLQPGIDFSGRAPLCVPQPNLDIHRFEEFEISLR